MTTDPGEAAQPFVRALSFGSVAENYERFRIGYSEELVDSVLDHAERPVRTALEVGAGTGKATRSFAERGLDITAVEPDAHMAKVLDRVVEGLPVRSVVTTFEQFHTESRFDMVYAAAAWHWTDPERRWTHAVELLTPGGVLAVFGGSAELADTELFGAVDAIEKDVLTADESDAHPWSIEEVADIDGLVDVEERVLPGVATVSAADFVGRLSTVSAYLQLAPEPRAEALRRVSAALPDEVRIDTTMRLTLARRG